MSSTVFFEEPELEFQYGQRMKDPRDGLSLFGPFDANTGVNPTSVRYVTIGSDEGIKKFRAWASIMPAPATFAPNNKHRLWIPFPGFEASFYSKWPLNAVHEYLVDDDKLIKASQLKDNYARAHSAVNMYLEALEKAKKLDSNIDVAICVIPDEVWRNCRPKSYVKKGHGESLSPKELASRKQGQLNLYETFEAEQYKLSPDFRRQLKARSMKYGIPLQLLRESTLWPADQPDEGNRRLTPLSDRMWNISTALYYKSGGRPWKISAAREGVCYIGIAFRKTELNERSRTACCAAQMFLDDGDGIVFLGEYGPWYSPTNNQFQLTKSAAQNLVAGALKTYQDFEGKDLQEIFIHSRSNISAQEYAGYRDACPSSAKVIGVRVRREREGVRLYRSGTRPVLRGTFLKIDESKGLLWGSGFKPTIGTYDGWEIPLPLQIEVQHGKVAIERVAQDIFALTKLNYNACRLGESQPVTIKFSDAVGEILVSNPTINDRRPQFKFYI